MKRAELVSCTLVLFALAAGHGAFAQTCTAVAPTTCSAGGSISAGIGSTPASVNGVYNVVAYGAVGNCSANGYLGGTNTPAEPNGTTACTDYSADIQNAINDAYNHGGAVYFPTNPAQSGQTVYYIASAVDFKGVSMYGPPGAGGTAQGQATLSPLAVAVRGAPGQDVFHSTDPANGGVAPLPAFTVRDLGVIVDNRVDASSSGTNAFPNRLPGRSCWDVSTTASMTAITSSMECEFQQGDSGQAVIVYGGGSSACPPVGIYAPPATPPSNCLVTTIASVQSGAQATLAAAPSSTLPNVHTYISIAGISAAQTAGNCAFAFDDRDGERAQNFSESVFERVTATATSENGANEACAYFFQANAAPYFVRWQQDQVNGTEFGFLAVPASNVAPSSSIWAGNGDFNLWDQDFVLASYPFILYDGLENTIRDVQIYSWQGYGPQLVSAYGRETYLWNWKVDIPEQESPATLTCSVQNYLRLSGTMHTVTRLPLWCGLQWDASESKATVTPDPNVVSNISGNQNDFYAIAYPNGTPTSFNVTGVGNTWTTNQTSPLYKSAQPARKQYVGGVTSPANLPGLARGSIALNRTHDFLDNGPGNYYYNGEDLWLWPAELFGTPGYANPTPVADTTAQSGTHFVIAAGGDQTMSGSNGAAWYIGDQYPAGPTRWYFRMQNTSSAGSANFDIRFVAGATQVLDCGVSVPSMSVVGWAIYSCDVDFTSYGGQTLYVEMGWTSKPAYAVNVDWVGVKPWSTDETVESLTLGAPSAKGTAMGASSGNGGVAQETTTATKIGGDAASYDASGNVVDSGRAASKLLANCGTMTTTAHSSDSLPCTWVTTSSTCTVAPSNSASVAWTYYAPSAGSVAVYHAATAGATYGIACSAN